MYLLLSLEDASLYMCGFGFVLATVMAIVSRPLFAGYMAVPSRKVSPRSILSNLRVQMSSFWNCRIYKIMLSEVLDTATIGTSYVSVFLLGAGLGEVEMTYMSAIAKISVLLACLLNLVKYKFSWSTRYADWFIFGHCIALFSCTYIFTAWVYTAWLPWWRGEVVEDADSMPTWMVVFYAISLSIGWLKGTMGLIKQEFFQVMIPPEDRGSIAGVKMFLCLMIMMVQTTVNLLLPTEYVYVVNFSMSMVTDLSTLAIVVSYKLDERRETRKGGELEKAYDYEKLPLTAEIEEDEDELYSKQS